MSGLQQGSAVQDYILHDPHDKSRIVCRVQVRNSSPLARPALCVSPETAADVPEADA